MANSDGGYSSGAGASSGRSLRSYDSVRSDRSLQTSASGRSGRSSVRTLTSLNTSGGASVLSSRSGRSGGSVGTLSAWTDDGSVIDQEEEAEVEHHYLTRAILANAPVATRTNPTSDWETLKAFSFYDDYRGRDQYETPDISEIIPGRLFIGNQWAAVSLELLKQLNIRTIINVTQDFPMPYSSHIHYLHVPIEDANETDISTHIANAADFIAKAIATDSNVYIHCQYGRSRSAAMLLAFLVRYAGLNLQQAYTTVRNARPIIEPNPGFVQQLREWEHRHWGVSSIKATDFYYEEEEDYDWIQDNPSFLDHNSHSNSHNSHGTRGGYSSSSSGFYSYDDISDY